LKSSGDKVSPYFNHSELEMLQSNGSKCHYAHNMIHYLSVCSVFSYKQIKDVCVCERERERAREILYCFLIHISGCQIMNDIHVGQIQFFLQYLSFVKKQKKRFFMQ